MITTQSTRARGASEKAPSFLPLRRSFDEYECIVRVLLVFFRTKCTAESEDKEFAQYTRRPETTFRLLTMSGDGTIGSILAVHSHSNTSTEGEQDSH